MRKSTLPSQNSYADVSGETIRDLVQVAYEHPEDTPPEEIQKILKSIGSSVTVEEIQRRAMERLRARGESEVTPSQMNTWRALKGLEVRSSFFELLHTKERQNQRQ